MSKVNSSFRTHCLLAVATIFGSLFNACSSGKKEVADLRIKTVDSAANATLVASVENLVKPVLDSGLTMQLWATDSLVISPIAIDIDDMGRLYYTTTNRQKNSEFDIRGHRDWELESIALQTIEDKRAFLRKTLSPENSSKNQWLADLNGDSSHDWRDMTIEKENVYRLEDTNGDGIADKSQLVVDDFNDEVTDVAGGVLSDEDNLYVAVGPDLWKLRDKNGDGIADEKTSLSHGYGIHIGFSGHGMSGVEMGPDGRIYWQIGDIGFNGTDKTGKKWEYPNSGVIARSNPDGSDFEIFASGIRNTHEFVFDEYANLISEDNDGDHAGERERLVYIVNGSDQGWRSNWQYGKYRDPKNNTYKVWMDEKMYLPRWEGQAAYIVPPISNFVSGPTGMLYNPGTALGPKYANTFFIVEFVGSPSASALHSFKLKPSGAGFTLGETKKIMSGVLPTGIDFGPDGAMYVADWIDGWGTHPYGRIWKLDVNAAAAYPERKQTKELLQADFKSKTPDELADILKNPDMRVRLKAQFELVKRGEKGAAIFDKSLQQKANQLARIHAVWGIAQLGRQKETYAAALLPYLKDSDPEIRAQSAKWLGDIRYKAAGEQLIPLLQDTAARVRFFAAEALGRMAHQPAIPGIISMLRANNEADVYLRHAGALALATIGQRDPVLALAGDSSKALRIAAVVALRRMAVPGIAVFLKDSDEFVVTETARAINDDLSIEKALPALGDILNTTSFNNEALIRRAISANLRTGTPAAMQNLISYAQKATAPAAMRAEAIAALSGWASPSVVDRVDGRYRGEVKRDAAGLLGAVAAPFKALLNSPDSAVRMATVKGIESIGDQNASEELFAILKSDRYPAIRVAAMKTLAALKDKKMDKAIEMALTDKDKTVRVAGLTIVNKLDIPKELEVNLLNNVIATRSMEEKQAAILTLGKVPLQYSASPIENLLNKMEKGMLSPELFLELGEAIDSTKSADLAAKYKNLSSKNSTSDVYAAYASALKGGDPNRGAGIFFWNQSAQCLRCHSYDDRGGNAGPRLNGVGKRLSREQILESLINPSAALAPGFGMVTLELKNGQTVSGTLKRESKTELVVASGNDADRTVKVSDVAKRTNAMSSMPDMKTILSKWEIRDVVAFLAGQVE